jgi:hypothetical protein
MVVLLLVGLVHVMVLVGGRLVLPVLVDIGMILWHYCIY